MAMYAALLSALPADERTQYEDHPNQAAAAAGAKALGLSTERVVELVRTYYSPRRPVALNEALALAELCIERAARNYVL